MAGVGDKLLPTLRLDTGGDVMDSLPSGGGGEVMSEVWTVFPAYLEDCSLIALDASIRSTTRDEM